MRTLQTRVSDRPMYLGFFGLGRSAGEKYVTLPMQPATPSNQTLTAWVGTQLAGFERSTGEPAEAALLVAHDRQHQGIGTLLLEYLADLGIRQVDRDYETLRIDRTTRVLTGRR